MNIKKFLVGAILGLFMLGGASIGVLAANSVVYDNIPSPTPGNVPSVGFEATSTSEFGGQVELAGTNRFNPTINVLMSSWGCQNGSWFNGDCVTTPGATFTHPITLNVYNIGPGDTVGSLIVNKTDTFSMPFRPSADNVNCTGADAGKWYNGTTCFNGKAFTISFDLTGTTLPDKVIIGVAYNTSHYGISPLAPQPCNATPQGCPYDSLNVGTNPAPTIGNALPTLNDVYQNSSWAGAYCSGDPGTFRLDSGCWTGYLPAIQIVADVLPVPKPTNQDQCKKNGWMLFNDPSFKNQGDCVSFVQSNPKALGNKNK